MYEIFFEMTMNLCKWFPSLSPFGIRREKAVEVLKLISRLGDRGRRETKDQDIRTEGDKTIIRRPAPDTWF